jgi:5-dehydro-2-deoxygluconokinase
LRYASGTGLAREPSRTTTLAALQRCRQRAIFDLDWREVLWEDPRTYSELASAAAKLASVVVGGASEFEAAALDPRDVLRHGPGLVIVKRGAQGATIVDGRGSRDVPGVAVPVVNGLGAGDAFAAALGATLIAGGGADEAVRRANAAGAIVAARVSCSTAMPRPDEVDAVLAGAPVVDGVVIRR